MSRTATSRSSISSYLFGNINNILIYLTAGLACSFIACWRGSKQQDFGSSSRGDRDVIRAQFDTRVEIELSKVSAYGVMSAW